MVLVEWATFSGGDEGVTETSSSNELDEAAIK